MEYSYIQQLLPDYVRGFLSEHDARIVQEELSKSEPVTDNLLVKYAAYLKFIT